MQLNNARVLFAAHYCAPYEGNFISSLIYLESKLKERYSAECAYLFPAKMLEQPWAEEFRKKHTCFYSTGEGDSKKLITGQEADDVLTDFHPTLIHTHFEGYDIPLYEAVKRSERKIRQVWHMRDTLTFQKNPLKSIYQCLCYFRHYGLPMLTTSLPPCIAAVHRHETDFIRKFRLGKSITETIIHNGVDLSRFRKHEKTQDTPFTFLAFGGRNIQKRIDLLFEAGEILDRQGITFNLIITKGVDTNAIAEKHFKGNIPAWLRLIDQMSDLNRFFDLGDCFVVTSVHETFCNAIIEATESGLPVIRSDIQGTEWSKNIPGILTFRSLDVNALVDSMKKIMFMSQSLIDANNEKAREIVLKEYSMETWASRMIQYFLSIP